MGQYVFKLPDIGEGTAQAEIAAWHVAVGAKVDEDQRLVDVSTDKATVEITSPVSGTIIALKGSPGEAIPVGAELVIFEVEGAVDITTPAAPKTPAKKLATAPAEPPLTATNNAPMAVTTTTSQDGPKATPVVRQKARDLGIDLALISGSGPGGRIIMTDLETRPSGGATRQKRTGSTDVKVIGVRRKIAEKMQESKRQIPHFSYIEEIDVTELEALRTELNALHGAARGKLTLLPFLISALTLTLQNYPQINALFDDKNGIVSRHAAVHIGIATQTKNGLLVPVLSHSEALGLWDLASGIRSISDGARNGTVGTAGLSGSTITITSLGKLGGLATTPIINYPEVAVIGVNKIVERPVVISGQIVIRKMMNLSSSFDHRVVDGWDAAAFIQDIKRLLEKPALMFVA